MTLGTYGGAGPARSEGGSFGFGFSVGRVGG